MGGHVAFLRGINVGGHRVTNDRLVSVAVDAGFGEVSAFLASGNLLLDAPVASTTQDTEKVLSTALEADLGYEVDVFARSAAEVVAVASVTPFDQEVVEAAKGKPQVTFLHDHPTPAQWLAVAELGTSDDLVELGDRCWFWLPEHGISGTALDLRAIERHIGVGTTRTLNTVSRLAAKST